MAGGYMGRILSVDLTERKITEETIPDSVYEKFLSGSGLGAFLLYNRIPENADPLGPDNIIGFVSGLLTGTGSLFTGRWMAVAKSPLTGGFGESNCGGNLSPAIKRCGYDGIFFSGISEKPVYLYVSGKKAELRDASDIWGKDAIETEEILIKRHFSGRKPRVACIGPAGERLSLISGISNDMGRMAARSGLGAVMGSKRLKAVVLNGSKKIGCNDKNEVKALSRKCNKWARFQPPFLSGNGIRILGAIVRYLPFQTAMDGMLLKILLSKWGTVSLNQYSIEAGDAPVKNWGGSNLDFAKELSDAVGPDRIKAHESAKYHCYSCPLGCGGVCSGPFLKEKTHKPEYETVTALGALLLNNDLESLFLLNDRLNRAGMDTISAGVTAAFAFECFEKGIITEKETGGLSLAWGDSGALIALIDKMIAREGIGDILADGVARAAEKIGKGAAHYAMHAGGQELPMHDARFDPGFGLHYVAEPTPGRHTIGSQLYYEMFRLWKRVPGLSRPWPVYWKGSKYKSNRKKALRAVSCSRFMNVLNGAGACAFGAFIGVDRFPVFEWLNAATGWNRTPSEYMDIGKRIHAAKHAFNLKHGIDPASVHINPRAVGSPPMEMGANRGRRLDMRQMLSDYWREYGYDEQTGRLRDMPETDLIPKKVVDHAG